jgi:hypothetical protein
MTMKDGIRSDVIYSVCVNPVSTHHVTNSWRRAMSSRSTVVLSPPLVKMVVIRVPCSSMMEEDPIAFMIFVEFSMQKLGTTL